MRNAIRCVAASVLVVATGCSSHPVTTPRESSTQHQRSVTPSAPWNSLRSPAASTGSRTHQASTTHDYAARFSGYVKNASGDAIRGICVASAEEGGDVFTPVVRTHTDGNGYYVAHIEDVTSTSPNHVHDVEFWDCSSYPIYAPQFATGVRVRWDHLTRNVNAKLGRGAAIRGKVQSDHGNAIPRLCVDVYDVREQGSGDPVNHFPLYRVYTGSDGTYRLGGLDPSRNAFILFADCAPRKYVREWWDNHQVPNGENAETSNTPSEAVPGLAAGKSVTGIDATLSLR